jgi:hypothetical protein
MSAFNTAWAKSLKKLVFVGREFEPLWAPLLQRSELISWLPARRLIVERSFRFPTLR